MKTFKQYFTESLWKNINAKKKRGGKSARKGSKAYKAAKKAGNKLNKTKYSDEEDAESSPGRVKRAGASCKGSVTELRKRAKKYGGEKGKMYHWCANMKGGKKKKSESEEGEHPGYADTTWSDVDGKTTVTMQDVEDKLTELKASVISIPVEDIKHLDIHTRHKPNKTPEQVKSTYDRAMKADLKYPIIITNYNGKYDMILDGNHRLHKAIETGENNIRARVLDLSKTPDWLGVFGYENEEDAEKKVSKTRAKCQAKAKRKYDVWPSAYASGYVQKCVNRGGNIK